MSLHSLSVGSLVELSGFPEVLEVGDLLGTSDGSSLKPIRPNGQVGKVVEHLAGGGYVVETFNAVRLCVPAESIKEFVRAEPAQGGFHLAWPADGEESEAAFAASIMELLTTDGYCVIQLSLSQELREKALQEAGKMKCRHMRAEFEPAYLGRQYKCKTAWMEGLAESGGAATSSGLDTCDIHLSSFTRFLLPLAPCALGFVPFSRTNAMIRMPYANIAEEGMLGAVELSDNDIDDGLVDNHIQFLRRRHVCMLLIVETMGGSLTLIHKDESKDNIELEPSRGRLIAFRTDLMTFIYDPLDRADLVLQSWVLEEAERLKFETLVGDQKSMDEATGILLGPNTPQGPSINVFGIGIDLPGGACVTDNCYWAAVAMGTDAQVRVPYSRFDMDLYSRDPDDWFPGTSYAVHGGFVCEDIYALDNKLFGIPEEQAKIMGPGHRGLLEKGYEALYKTGFRQGEDLKGRPVGVFVGHSGDDWSFTQQFTIGWEDCYKKGHESRSWCCLAGRLSYSLGLRGPQSLTDTACSSALVAYGVGHAMLRATEHDQARAGVDNRLTEALMCGVNLMPGPGNYINLCGPHMLSALGRCFTFDHSADGFARGEGFGAFFVKREDRMSEESYATVIGACLNEDGRSASMTAPNGPAQQECIKGSMMEAGLTANQVTCAECHGTGTALGDPIEVGALRGVMQDRVIPIIQTSAKAHIGHLEAAAGTGGILKCMLMCAACAGTPNCHLIELNPHLDINGYPTIFASELSDYGFNSGYSGVSSFGFGGANSRADVFASAKRGPHVTGRIDWEKVDYVTVKCPFDQGPMHYTDGKCIPHAKSRNYKHDVYRASAIRGEFDTYDYSSSLYEGTYQLEPRDEGGYDKAPKDPIFIVGSWDHFRKGREMEPKEEEEEGDAWTFRLALGETRCERFQLRVNNDSSQALYPCALNGSMCSRCIGPDDEGEGYFWIVDGRDAMQPQGTVYEITFTWGSPPKLRWEVVDDDAPPEWSQSYQHRYCVLGSWTGGVMQKMQNVSTPDSENTWEFHTRIGTSGMEWFRFVRDHDLEQQVYPAQTGTCKEDVPVCGPDDMSNEKSWRLRGSPGELATLQLQVVDGRVAVTVSHHSLGTCSMHSIEGPHRHAYYISGSFNDWKFTKMDYDEKTVSTFKFRGRMSEACQESFYICAEADPELAFFPEVEASYPGTVIVAGPEEMSENRLFYLYCLKAGAEFEIVFDRNSVDKRKIVDVNWVTGRVDSESMKRAYSNFYNIGKLRASMLADQHAPLPKLTPAAVGSSG